MKPKNRAQLIRYLHNSPSLRWEYPTIGLIYNEKKEITGHQIVTEKEESRKFLRMQNNCFVFETPTGQESFLDAKAKDITFNDDHFAVDMHRKNPDLKMKYFYI